MEYSGTFDQNQKKKETDKSLTLATNHEQIDKFSRVAEKFVIRRITR